MPSYITMSLTTRLFTCIFEALRGSASFLICHFSKKHLSFIKANHAAVKVRMRRTSFFESRYFHTGKARRAYYCVVALYNSSLALLIRGELHRTGSGDRFFEPFLMKILRDFSMTSSSIRTSTAHCSTYKRQIQISSSKNGT